jgi:ParB-like chromosome segregation protein Spo0J
MSIVEHVQPPMRSANVSPHATGTTARVNINDIKNGTRHRRDLGDLTGLVESIREIGLLHPPVINRNNKLIAGARRLKAVKMLGWKKVPVRVIDLGAVVKGEWAENVHRKDFTLSEAVAIKQALEPLEQAAAKDRQREHGKTAPGRKHSGQVAHSDNGRAADKAAKATAWSRRTLEKAEAVVTAAEKDERFRRLVEEMDRTGKVDRYYSELRRVQVEESDAVPITGDAARVIVGDYRDKGRVIEENSVDLIFTDPAYCREAIPLYGDLAKFAARVLIDGGSLICYVGHYALPETLELILPHLRYHWINAVMHTGGRRVIRGKYVHVGWKPLLWFTKGSRRTKMLVGDCVVSRPGNKISQHPWAQGEPEARYYIEHLSRRGSLIVDPYCGGGTTGVCAINLGRRFIGFELDPSTASKAETRIAVGGR